MSPEQLADVLVAIARTQAAIADAVSSTNGANWNKSPVWDSFLGEVGAIPSQHPVKPTFTSLQAELIELAASPGSSGFENLQQKARSGVARLLQQESP